MDIYYENSLGKRIYFDRKEKEPLFTALYEYDRHTGIYRPYKMFLNGE